MMPLRTLCRLSISDRFWVKDYKSVCMFFFAIFR